METTDRKNPHPAPRVLIIYYSFSRQTRKLVKAAEKGLVSAGVEVTHERLIPVKYLRFPFGSFLKTVKMMIITFFRKRMQVADLSPRVFQDYDLIILAGPTWSFNPCGPVLSFLDRYCTDVFPGRRVLPVISCRSYWRYHGAYLKKRIRKCGGHPMEPWAFDHPVPEPWNTIGLFLTVMGKNPRRVAILKKFYTRYGHSNRQIEEMKKRAHDLGMQLNFHVAPPMQRNSPGHEKYTRKPGVFSP